MCDPVSRLRERPFRVSIGCHHNQSHFPYPTSHREQLCRVESKHSRSTSQAEIIKVHTIGMGDQKESAGRKGGLGGKVNRSGRPHDTYDQGPHPSQRRVQDVQTPEGTPTVVGRNPIYAPESEFLDHVRSLEEQIDATNVKMTPDKRTLLCLTMALWNKSHYRSLVQIWGVTKDGESMGNAIGGPAKTQCILWSISIGDTRPRSPRYRSG